MRGCACLQGLRFKLNYDGMYYLVIPQTRPLDAGEIVVVARSVAGEAQATATLDVSMHQDWRNKSLKPARHRTQEELQEREAAWREQTMGKLGSAFAGAPRPNVQKLMSVERAKTPPPTLESEELRHKFSRKREEEFYDKILAAERDKQVPFSCHRTGGSPLLTSRPELLPFRPGNCVASGRLSQGHSHT